MKGRYIGWMKNGVPIALERNDDGWLAHGYMGDELSGMVFIVVDFVRLPEGWKHLRTRLDEMVDDLEEMVLEETCQAPKFIGLGWDTDNPPMPYDKDTWVKPSILKIVSGAG
jgi:hypothetical protein